MITPQGMATPSETIWAITSRISVSGSFSLITWLTGWSFWKEVPKSPVAMSLSHST